MTRFPSLFALLCMSASCSPSQTTVPAGAVPQIAAFEASATSSSAGAPVTLTWSTSGETYAFIDLIGPQRAKSLVVTPATTTTYTLHIVNA